MKFAHKLALNVLDKAIVELIGTLKEKRDGFMSFFYEPSIISKKIAITSALKEALSCSLQEDNWYDTLTELIADYRDELNNLCLEKRGTVTNEPQELEQLLKLSLKECTLANVENIDFDESDLFGVFKYAALTYISIYGSKMTSSVIRDHLRSIRNIELDLKLEPGKELPSQRKDQTVLYYVTDIAIRHIYKEKQNERLNPRVLVFLGSLAELADPESYTQRFCCDFLTEHKQDIVCRFSDATIRELYPPRPY